MTITTPQGKPLSGLAAEEIFDTKIAGSIKAKFRAAIAGNKTKGDASAFVVTDIVLDRFVDELVGSGAARDGLRKAAKKYLET